VFRPLLNIAVGVDKWNNGTSFGIAGGLLFSMGLLGYIFSRSTISLVLGIAPGLATLLLGTLSLKFLRSGRSSFLLILAQA
ncbi:hypothetical protein ACJX0J_019321, partial [Zea mays]